MNAICFVLLMTASVASLALAAQAEPLSAKQQAEIKKWPPACQKLIYKDQVTKDDMLQCAAAGGIPR